MTAEQLKTISKEIDDANQAAFKEGLAAGLAVANRIMQLWHNNGMKLDPKSDMTLFAWSEGYIEDANRLEYKPIVPIKK